MEKCPTCGNKFETERGKKIHITKKHKQKSNVAVCENVKKEVSNFRSDENQEGAYENKQLITNVSQNTSSSKKEEEEKDILEILFGSGSSYGSTDKEKEGKENRSSDNITYGLKDGNAIERRQDDTQSTEKSCCPPKERYNEGASKDIVKDFDSLQVDDNSEGDIAEILKSTELNDDTKVTRVLKNLTKPELLPGRLSRKVWKLVLKYMVNKDYQLYIVSPFLDTKRLQYILKLLTENSKENNCMLIATKSKPTKEWSIQEIAADAKKNIKQDKSLLDDKVYQTIYIPKNLQHFHCKYLAGIEIDENIAHVLMTSANFNDNHFKSFGEHGEGNLDLWSYCKMTCEEFQKKLLTPLQNRLIVAPDMQML